MRAEDDEGTTWEFSENFHLPETSSEWDAAILNSTPAIAMCIDNRITFKHSNDVAGTHWNSEVVADNLTSVANISLADINSHPAIAYCEDGTSHVHWSIRDLNYPPYWREPQQVNFHAINPKSGAIKLACIADKPAILAAFYDNNNNYGMPQYAEVTGNDPLRIEEGKYIDAMYNVSSSVQLVDYLGNPAIAYTSGYYNNPIVAVRMDGAWNYSYLTAGYRPLGMFVINGKLVIPSGSYYYTSPVAYFVEAVAWME